MENQNKSIWSWRMVAAVSGTATALVAGAAWLTYSILGRARKENLARTPPLADEELPRVVESSLCLPTERLRANTSPDEVNSFTCSPRPSICASIQETIILQDDIGDDDDDQGNSWIMVTSPHQAKNPRESSVRSRLDCDLAQETNVLEELKEDEKNKPEENGIMVTSSCQVRNSTENSARPLCDCGSAQKNNTLEGPQQDKKNKSKKNGCTSAQLIPPPKLCNLNALLADIYRRHVALRDQEFNVYYAVFNDVFAVLQENMKAVDCYYQRYNSRKQFAGSHADKLRIGRPDEFDMDVVIRMPLCYAEAPNPDESDLVMECHVPGHVWLRGGRQYASLPSRDNWDINQTAYKWCDGDKYILRSKFTDWFKSVVRRALNRLPKGTRDLPTVEVEGEVYHLSTRESGPACTLTVQRDDGFRLDVDLVPALKFPEGRWPLNSDYRKIPLGCQFGDWLVVPKAARGAENASRSWRVALHVQEKRLIDNQQRLRQAIRLIKKMRDALGMKEIASYYIKTLFLWEKVERKDCDFWGQSEGVIFKVMVRKLCEAVRVQRIPYFWNEKNNLIGHVSPQVLDSYRAKLEKLVHTLEKPCIPLDEVAKFLLTPAEYEAYKEFF